jgi:hypothetical protein
VEGVAERGSWQSPPAGGNPGARLPNLSCEQRHDSSIPTECLSCRRALVRSGPRMPPGQKGEQRTLEASSALKISPRTCARSVPSTPVPSSRSRSAACVATATVNGERSAEPGRHAVVSRSVTAGAAWPCALSCGHTPRQGAPSQPQLPGAVWAGGCGREGGVGGMGVARKGSLPWCSSVRVAILVG